MILFSRRRFNLVAASSLLTLAAPMRGMTQTLSKTTIANASGNLNLVVQEILRQKRFLEDLGVDPRFLNVADGSKIVAGLIGRDLDSSMMSGIGQVFPAIEKGARLQIIAAASFAPTLALYTSKADIHSLKDLEGRTVGIGALGSLLHQLVVALLKKHSVDIAKVRFVNIGSSGDVFRATTLGTVDAGTGEAAILEDMSHYPSLKLIPNGNMTVELTDYTYQGSWTSEYAIQTKRDILVRCLAAQAKLYRFLHDPDSRDIFLAAHAAVLPNAPADEGMAQWLYVQKYKPFATGLVMSDERLSYIQQLNVDLNVQSKIMQPDRVADMSLAIDALKLLEKSGG